MSEWLKYLSKRHMKCFFSYSNTLQLEQSDVIISAETVNQQKQFWFIKGALWSFLVNKQTFCLHSASLTRTHCVYPWGLTDMLNSFPSSIKHFQNQQFEECVVYIHVYMLSVFLFPAFAGASLCFLACHRHLWITGIVWNHWQECESCHPCACASVHPLIKNNCSVVLLEVKNSTGCLLVFLNHLSKKKAKY